MLLELIIIIDAVKYHMGERCISNLEFERRATLDVDSGGLLLRTRTLALGCIAIPQFHNSATPLAVGQVQRHGIDARAILPHLVDLVAPIFPNVAVLCPGCR